jgi:outer membrane protein assembly factor BamB
MAWMATALPIAVDGNVYTQEEAGGGGMQLVCRNGTTGAVVWQTTETGMGISWSQPALAENRVVVATDWGGIYAFESGAVTGSWYMMQQNPALTGSDTGWIPEPPLPGRTGPGPWLSILLGD